MSTVYMIHADGFFLSADGVAEWRIYAPVVNFAIIGSDNGLSAIQWQSIFWINDVLLPIGHQQHISVKLYL